MELKVDISEKAKKSPIKVVLGILFLVLACSWIGLGIIDQEGIGAYDWVFFGVFILNGIFNIIEGFGVYFEKFYSNAHILINSELISIKQSLTDRKRVVYWDEIKSVDCRAEILKIEKTEGKNVLIDISELSYYLRSDIKDTICSIAKEKNIESNI